MKLICIILTSIVVSLTMFPKSSYSSPRSSYMENGMWKHNVNYKTNKMAKDREEHGGHEFDWDEEVDVVHDLIYRINKTMFDLNDKIYFYFLKPTLAYYRSIMPLPVRISMKNFFHNITMPTRFINCLLQCKWDSAQAEMARFIVNSTFGIGGLFDPASKYSELTSSEEDMGQTLGSYKIGNGFYIVWPILGPSTLRDSIGMVGDCFLNPINHIAKDINDRISVSSVRVINRSSFKMDEYETIKSAAIDPYEAFRDAYIQNRNNKIAQ